jgi:aminopeptidase N
MSLHVLRAGLPLVLMVGCATAPAAPREARSEAEARFDVEHYALDLSIDPATRSLRGSCRIRLWPAGAAIGEVELDFVGLHVDSVEDVDGRDLGFRQGEASVRVDLAQRVDPGAFAEFTVHYSGRPQRGLHFTAERDGLPTQVYTQGECIDARAWFPCQDEPWERATSELCVRVPRDWKVLAAGERIERTEDGATATELWRTTFPHPAYLETLVAGEFAVAASEWDGVPLVFAAAPRLAADIAPTFVETADVLAYFSSRTGVRYPYPKYSQAAVDGFQYGGMENVSATTLVDSAVTDAAARLDASPRGLIAHEAAHQWFGDLVTCADWSHAWLNEGFATYFTDLYVESALGNDAFLLAVDDQRRGWLARDAGTNRRPIVHAVGGDPIQGFFSGHVYEGGAVRLHHLRRLLGDAAFFRGVQSYLGENAGRGVVTDDLRRALESSSGRDLRTHFDRWFRSHGHPRIEFAARYEADRRELAIDVRQVQEDAPFPCLVEVEVADENGVRVERLELEGRSEHFALPQSIAPKWVRLDPGCALPAEIAESRTYDEWLAILAAAPDAAGRRSAAEFLGAKSREALDGRLWERIVRGLTEAAHDEASPDVRRRIVEQLDPSQKSAAKGTLCDRAAHDTDASVRAAAFRALEASGEDAVVADLARAEVARDVSYVAVGAALGALARAEPGDSFAMLAEQLRIPSPHGEREARVLAEIVRLPDPRSANLLRGAAVDESLPDAPRRVAIAELGRVAKTDPEARAALLTALDSRRLVVRRDAIAALTNAVTPEVRTRLERLARVAVDSREKSAIARALAAQA